MTSVHICTASSENSNAAQWRRIIMRMILYERDTIYWYSVYQRLVRFVPVLGSVSTNHWYDEETFPYDFTKISRGDATCGSVIPNRSSETMQFSLINKSTYTYKSSISVF